MNRYIGVDVHQDKCHATVQDKDGRILQQEYFQNSPKVIGIFLKGSTKLKSRLRLGMPGNHGLIAKVRAEDRGEISEFVEDRVSTYQGVKDVNITMTMETYKEDLLDL